MYLRTIKPNIVTLNDYSFHVQHTYDLVDLKHFQVFDSSELILHHRKVSILWLNIQEHLIQEYNLSSGSFTTTTAFFKVYTLSI